jgi:uncharacterized protein (DUF1330 family)
MSAYTQAAGPLAAEAGLQMVSRTEEVHLLKGEWPFEGRLIIERYSSLQALLDFWYSEGYQEAKKLREGLLGVNFLVAVEGVEP